MSKFPFAVELVLSLVVLLIEQELRIPVETG